MDIQNLIEKRAQKWQEAKTFLDEHTDKDGNISAEDAAAYDKMETVIFDLGKNIERLQRAEKLENELNKPTSTPVLNIPNATAKIGRASDEYRKAALEALRTNFKSVSNYLNESTDGAGGYLVPAEWDDRLIESLSDANIMRQLGTIIQTSGNHKINIAGAKPAGAWIDEGAEIVFCDTSFTQVTLGAHKLAVAVKVTNELLYDSMFNLENHILNQFSRELAEMEEDAFLNGAASDTTTPTGLFATASADSSTVVTATGTSGTTITADNVLDLVYKLKRPYRKNAVFIMNDSTLAEIRKLKDNNQQYLWQPSYREGEPDRLLGYPVYTSTFAPVIASGAAVIAFGDISYYNIADRGIRSFIDLKEKFATNYMTAFLMVERVDGALVLPEAVRVLKMKA